jgi:hypothetical protein
MKFLHSIADTCKLDRGKLDQTTKKNEKKTRELEKWGLVCPLPSNDNPGTRELEAIFSTRLPG